MAEKKELNPSPRFPSGDYPELSPNPNQVDGLVNKTGEQPNTQFVNPERKQENSNLTVSQVIYLIQKYGAEHVKFIVTNIKSLTDAQCEILKAGDIVVKKTGNQYHAYIVSYNENNQGLCLTYSDASVVETVSYDYIDGHWVYNSTDKSEDAINEVINESLLSGTLKTAFQAKTFAVSDFPLTSDIDNQHATVNEGKLPDGNMSDLTESQINRLVVTLNRIINKGWLKTSTLKALKLTSVMYDNTIISIVANSIVFNAIDVGGIVSGFSYLITLDIANASYSYSYGSYNIIQ